ncbi:MAG: endonuclease [Acidobacteria bacterium]|nr:endonuclease [Acidobacteriota bacterium]
MHDGCGILVSAMRGPCRWCKGDVSGRRRTFCSDACVHEWRLRSSGSYLRECIFERDRGICAICRIDTVALRRRILRLPFGRRIIEMKALRIVKGRKSWWEADHIVPVVEGGDSNLDNIRTLCVTCHRNVTAELRERRLHSTR